MSKLVEFGVELGLTPVKSTMRTSPDELVFDEYGMFGDRELMFVEAEGRNVGKFISLRADGVMALVESVITDDGVLLDHPDAGIEKVPRQPESEDNRMAVSVHTWNGVGIDQGEKAAEWGREVFDRAVRLVRVSEERPRFVENNQRLGRVGFSDGYPLLVVSKGSVNAISDFMVAQGATPIEARNFGPNILLDSETPFIEDYIKSITFESEGMVWELIRRKACGRCVMPSRRPDDGEMREGITVLGALAEMGRKGTHVNLEFPRKPERFFGQNFIIRPPRDLPVRRTGILRASTKVTAHINDTRNWEPVAA